MKKIFFAFLLCSITTPILAAQTIRFASSATNPPFEFFDEQNQFAGFDIDLAKAVCIEMQTDCTFTNQAFDSLISALKFRRFDAVIAGMDITAERSQQVLFSDPYYANSAILIVRKNTYNSITQLADKKVGMENGSTHQKYINARHPEIKTVAYESYQSAVLDLQSGRIDAVFGDKEAVKQWVKKINNLTVLGEPVTDPTYFGSGLGIAVRKDNVKLNQDINTALAKLKQNGQYQQILDKWFSN